MAPAEALEFVVEIEDDLGQRHLVDGHAAARVNVVDADVDSALLLAQIDDRAKVFRWA